MVTVTRTPRWVGPLVVAIIVVIVGVLIFAARAPGPVVGSMPSPTAPSAGTPTSAPQDLTTPSPGAIPSTVIHPTDAPATPVVSVEPASSGDTTAGASLADLVGRLRVADEVRAGYDRDLFLHWIDDDADGCNTRYEVLIVEAVTAPTVGTNCSLTGGSWYSVYDGLSFTDPGDLDVDHVVALVEAWDSGAYGWTPGRRRDFANDLGVPFALIAVSAGSNRTKSDQDPADWLPPLASAQCPFAGAWIAVKVRWGLSVDLRELAALQALADACPDTTMPYEPAPTAAPTPIASPGSTSTACDAAYPTVCIPPSPPDLDCGEITYRDFVVLAPDPHRFDGNHDGVGCQT